MIVRFIASICCAIIILRSVITMKSVTMFVLEACPYCREALVWMEELQKEEPKYSDLEIIKIDERRQSKIANLYDYYYVPCYYVDGRKVHEGAATKAIVKEVLENAFSAE